MNASGSLPHGKLGHVHVEAVIDEPARRTWRPRPALPRRDRSSIRLSRSKPVQLLYRGRGQGRPAGSHDEESPPGRPGRNRGTPRREPRIPFDAKPPCSDPGHTGSGPSNKSASPASSGTWAAGPGHGAPPNAMTDPVSLRIGIIRRFLNRSMLAPSSR